MSVVKSQSVSWINPTFQNVEARHRLIDVLRGVSALAVVWFHLNESYPALPDLYHRMVEWGWLGVAVFFVISGFCIAAARQKEGAIPFWYRRLVRIFPPYWASLAIVTALIGLRLVTVGVNDITILPKDLTGVANTLAALTFPATTTANMNWVYWSLGYELAFYILMGGLVVRGKPTGLILFSVLALILPGFPFDKWGAFGLGTACYYLTKNQWKTGGMVGVLCIAQSFRFVSPAEAITGLVAALFILYPPRFVLGGGARPFMWLGTLSYSLYLTHVPIGCYFLPYYWPWGFERTLGGSLLQDLVFLPLCIGFAYGFYRLVEKPSHEIARRGLKRGPA